MANPYRDEKTGRFITKADFELQQRSMRMDSDHLNIMREQNEILKEQNTSRREARSLAKKILNDKQEELITAEELEKIGEKRLRSEDDLTAKIISAKVRQAELEYDIQAARDAGDDKSADILIERKQDQQDLLDLYEQELDDRRRVNDELGAMDDLMNALEGVPFLKDFIEGEDVIHEMEQAILRGDDAMVGFRKGIEDSFQGFGKLAKSLFEFDSARDIFNFLKTSMFEVSEQTTKFSKSLGLSSSDASSLRVRMADIAMDSNSLAVTTADTTAAFHNLNEQFGTASTVLRADIVGEMARLSELTGMSAEAQGRFASMAMRTGTHAAEITKQARQAVVEGEKERGVRVDINKVLDEAGQVTGVIAANLGFNVVEISKAITVAKQFGMTLEDLAGISANLLNFNQSIEAELQAELFTGKQLNLEQARLAALTGDYATLTKEIMNNVGSELEFANMNVLAKEKMAAALGMSVDAMSDLVFQNANLAELAQEARDAGDEELAASLEKRDAQQKYNDLIEKAQSIMVDFLAPALDYLSNVMQGLADNSGLLYGIIAGLAVIKLGGLVSGAISLATALAAAGIGSTTLMSGLTLGIGAAAIIGGFLAITAAANKGAAKMKQEAKDINDGIIDPDGGLVVSGPKGSINLNKDDSIIAGTNLMGGGQNNRNEELNILKKLHSAFINQNEKVGVIAYSPFDAIKASNNYTTKYR